ncbi:hypothetical protein HQ325_16670 [Rhodococcus sp. BP-349]|uniref:hypothetical protein n=1 Tax=unclassified Rhodococcus (in: high G+C Gram-positive bacteria) TaxID=192944 RepID=UPI001C9A514B|nr:MULTISPECIES: hypothetical protein [unclassified Rhodococcus (in: high G+C Gram-positive bacteria)]MBY6540309.1 hypothetical protein [Rhodococcus sp. BP-363]MBY6545666.1 hypothetical protein [Rhodococcus sp. BP-369]MBY6564896.1 hypothetical protein [Rhodococcus sp. BP-370]MBY6578168.1 hypothetical protein [Rhodococcus sp. BP-364]MBY6587469.1 hypothetical protein [Rhodococcus sp. BP-358]
MTDFHLSALSGSMDVSVTFDGQAPTQPPVVNVQFALNIDNLRRMFSDPEQAAGAYVHDLHLIPTAALSKAPGATTVVQIV